MEWKEGPLVWTDTGQWAVRFELQKATTDFLKVILVTFLQGCVLMKDSYFQRFHKAVFLAGEVILPGRWLGFWSGPYSMVEWLVMTCILSLSFLWFAQGAWCKLFLLCVHFCKLGWEFWFPLRSKVKYQYNNAQRAFPVQEETCPGNLIYWWKVLQKALGAVHSTS